jgi:hypothetical protein
MSVVLCEFKRCVILLHCNCNKMLACMKKVKAVRGS